jgi:fructosamine-3-kinase
MDDIKGFFSTALNTAIVSVNQVSGGDINEAYRIKTNDGFFLQK